MPKPIAVAKRRQIVERHLGGESLKSIAERLEMPYSSVRNVWRVYRQEGRVEPNYSRCGPQTVKASQRVYRAACYLKRWHPKWGARLIRQVIRDKWPAEQVPHERSLQRWFQAAGIQPSRRKKRLESTRVGRGTAPHNIWAMDSREQIEVADGDLVSWLLVSDEASGAVLSGQVFPPVTRSATQRGSSVQGAQDDI